LLDDYLDSDDGEDDGGSQYGKKNSTKSDVEVATGESDGCFYWGCVKRRSTGGLIIITLDPEPCNDLFSNIFIDQVITLLRPLKIANRSLNLPDIITLRTRPKPANRAPPNLIQDDLEFL